MKLDLTKSHERLCKTREKRMSLLEILGVFPFCKENSFKYYTYLNRSTRIITISSATARSPLRELIVSGLPHTTITGEEKDKERKTQWSTYKHVGTRYLNLNPACPCYSYVLRLTPIPQLLSPLLFSTYSHRV